AGASDRWGGCAGGRRGLERRRPALHRRRALGLADRAHAVGHQRDGCRHRGALFHTPIAPHYGVAVALFAAAAALLASRRFVDVYGLSAVGLGIDTVLVGGVAWGLLHDHHGVIRSACWC